MPCTPGTLRHWEAWQSRGTHLEMETDKPLTPLDILTSTERHDQLWGGVRQIMGSYFQHRFRFKSRCVCVCVFSPAGG